MKPSIYKWDHHSFQDIGYHSGAIYDVQWNCDGTYLASACADKTVKIAALDAKNGTVRMVQTCTGMTSPRQVCWHPTESSTFAIAGEDKIVELWEVRDQKPKARISTGGGNINISWSPSGKHICVGNDYNKLLLIDVSSQQVIPNSHLSMKYEVNQMAWGATGSHIVLASGEEDMGNVDVLAATVTTTAKGELNAELKVQASVHAHTSNCTQLKIDSNKQIMAVSSTDQTVSLWRVGELMCYKSIHFEGIIRCLSFSPNGACLAISGENFVKVYSTRSAELIKQIDCQRKVMHVSFHPTEAMLILGTDGKNGAAMRMLHVGMYMCVCEFRNSARLFTSTAQRFCNMYISVAERLPRRVLIDLSHTHTYFTSQAAQVSVEQRKQVFLLQRGHGSLIRYGTNQVVLRSCSPRNMPEARLKVAVAAAVEVRGAVWLLAVGGVGAVEVLAQVVGVKIDHDRILVLFPASLLPLQQEAVATAQAAQLVLEQTRTGRPDETMQRFSQRISQDLLLRELRFAHRPLHL